MTSLGGCFRMFALGFIYLCRKNSFCVTYVGFCFEGFYWKRLSLSTVTSVLYRKRSQQIPLLTTIAPFFCCCHTGLLFSVLVIEDFSVCSRSDHITCY